MKEVYYLKTDNSELRLIKGESKTFSFDGIFIHEDKRTICPYVPLCYTAAGLQNHWLHFQSGQNTFMQMKTKKVVLEDKKLEVDFDKDDNGISAKVSIESVAGTYIQQNTVKACGKEMILTGLNSGVVDFFPFKRFERDRFELSFFKQSWQAEGCLCTVTFEEAGIGVFSTHPSSSVFRIENRGTHTTSEFYPLIFVYDKKTDQTAFYQIFPAAEWNIEVGIKAGWIGDDCCVFINGSCFDERFSGGPVILAEEESFTARKCLYGITHGNIFDAVKVLYKARRIVYSETICKVPNVYYNDYLNCCWADPKDEITIPIAKKSAELGFDYFVIDAGWFSDRNEKWDKTLGDWKLSSDRFEGGTINSIISKIRDLGLKAGVWTECEVCGENSEIYKKPDEWFLRLYGKRIGGGNRIFFDFTDQNVREYIENLFLSLAKAGVTYIKNDYNDSVFKAEKRCDFNHLEDSLNEYFLLIEKIRKVTGIVIEGCASGGMRNDPEMIGKFDFLSISDQEIYYNYPPIIKGCLMQSLPEKLGVWGVCNPLYFQDYISGKYLSNASGNLNDDNSLVFNLVNSMTGVFYFSGRLDYNNEKSDDLIKSAIKIYKTIVFPFIINAYPSFYGKYKHIGENGIDNLIFENENKTECLLYIWRHYGEEETVFPSDYGSCEKVFDPFDRFEVKKEGELFVAECETDIYAAIYRLKK